MPERVTKRSHQETRTALREAWYLFVSGRWLTFGVVVVVALSVGSVLTIETLQATRATRTETEAIADGRDVARFRLDEGGVSVTRCLSLDTWSNVQAVATVGSSINVDGLDVVAYAGDLSAVLGVQPNSNTARNSVAIVGANLRSEVSFESPELSVNAQSYPVVWGPATNRARTIRSVVLTPTETNDTAQECWVLLNPTSPHDIETAIATLLADSSNIAVFERQTANPSRADSASSYLDDPIHGLWRLLGVLVSLFVILYGYTRKSELALYADLGFRYSSRLVLSTVCGLIVIGIGIPIGMIWGSAIALTIAGPGQATLDTALSAVAPLIGELLLAVAVASSLTSRASDLASRR